jgi:hypothetical protein
VPLSFLGTTPFVFLSEQKYRLAKKQRPRLTMHLFRKKNIVDTNCSLHLLIALSIIGAEAQANILGWNDAAPKCDPLQAPTVPEKLQAVPGNQNMTLTWAFPSNGACVDNYNVTYYSVQPQGEVGTPVEVDTTTPNTTITGLINGVKYVFSVSVSCF